MLHSTVTRGTRVVRRFDGKAGTVVDGGTLRDGTDWVAVEIDGHGVWSGSLVAWDYADDGMTTTEGHTRQAGTWACTWDCAGCAREYVLVAEDVCLVCDTVSVDGDGFCHNVACPTNREGDQR
jgi:hypothetical protein